MTIDTSAEEDTEQRKDTIALSICPVFVDIDKETTALQHQTRRTLRHTKATSYWSKSDMGSIVETNRPHR